MARSLTEILAEKDKEFTYYVRSTADIHNPEVFSRVRMSLLPYQIKLFDADKYLPWSKGNKKFPLQPNSPVYSIKVITGLPIDCRSVLQLVAIFTNVHIAHLMMEPEEGGDAAIDFVPPPKEVDADDAQILVGQKRIGAFVQELKANRKFRNKLSTVREIYESYFTTHRAVAELIKKPVLNGYYLIETFKEGQQTCLRAEGPYTNRPDGNTYKDNISGKNLGIITESTVGGMNTIKVLLDLKEDYDVAETLFEVKVEEKQSGKQFKTLVRATTPKKACEMAVEQVAEAHNIPADKLVATKSEAKTSGANWEF